MLEADAYSADHLLRSIAVVIVTSSRLARGIGTVRLLGSLGSSPVSSPALLQLVCVGCLCRSPDPSGTVGFLGPFDSSPVFWCFQSATTLELQIPNPIL
jgi:hypothetical protein